jgi:hypothetical protein
MSYNKNVVEDALFQIRNLEETLQENAKGILQSTMSEEIRQLVKESLKEKDEEEVEEPANDDEVEVDAEMDMGPEDMEMDDEEDMEMDDEEDMEMDDEEDMEMDDEEDMEMEPEDDMEMDDEEDAIDMTDASDEEVLRVFKAMGDDDGIVVKKEGDYIHLTDEDDDYMIQLGESYNELDEENMENVYEIEMDNETNEMMDSDKTIYEVEMMEDMDSDFGEYSEDMDSDFGEYSEDMDSDYEGLSKMNKYMMESKRSNKSKRSMKSKKSITPKGVGIGKGPKFGYDKKPNMSGGFSEKKKEAFGKGIKAMGTGKAKFEYKEGEKMGVGKNTTVKKMETKEASRTLGSGSNFRRGGLPKPRAHSSFNTAINEELELMKEKNNEYKKALDVFRTKLNEVAVFNSNLAYATRLFTEHSTTKQEKINILRRFDNVESLKESKNLYRSIKSELGSGSTHETKINESVDRKINRTVESGSSVNLIESKTYENPQFLRMKDLMTKLK